ncbi:hypothetical protein WOLCODRAFT_137179 [Wolfiporia cocos MD-104 SS10]|uniref:Uncharacterized protein n=1 Tax=Wolfiporia cocos (strain MD-104) TaxID=742152 RepID=A0A2H3JFV5_WOLCO|nr:hypothetical protein WOLCODRAFT_137179 [Wolfiporia cocos MD-104 SS10]
MSRSESTLLRECGVPSASSSYQNLQVISRERLHASLPVFPPNESGTAVNSVDDLHARSYMSHVPGLLPTRAELPPRCHSASSSASRPRRRCEAFTSMWNDVKFAGLRVRVKFSRMFRTES